MLSILSGHWRYAHITPQTVTAAIHRDRQISNARRTKSSRSSAACGQSKASLVDCLMLTLAVTGGEPATGTVLKSDVWSRVHCGSLQLRAVCDFSIRGSGCQKPVAVNISVGEQRFDSVATVRCAKAADWRNRLTVFAVIGFVLSADHPCSTLK